MFEQAKKNMTPEQLKQASQSMKNMSDDDLKRMSQMSGINFTFYQKYQNYQYFDIKLRNEY